MKKPLDTGCLTNAGTLASFFGGSLPSFIPELDLALNTGMRLGEMYSLTSDGVNLSRKVLAIPRSKNGEMRHMPLNSDAISALEAFRKRGGGTGKVIRNLVGESLAGSRYWFEPVRDPYGLLDTQYAVAP